MIKTQKGWTPAEINKHKTVARLLLRIKDDAFGFIKQKKREKKKVTEYDVQQFILKLFKENNLVSDKDPPIVAAGRNTRFVHYYPKRNSKQIKEEDIIMIDIWARLKDKKAPFADITWMGYTGRKIPNEIRRVFKTVIAARNKGINFIRKNLKKDRLPKASEIDSVVRRFVTSRGFPYTHKRIGHTLGFNSPHGKGRHISKKEKREIFANVGYTIEPDICLKNFGIRSEIDFLITEHLKLIITTDVQRKIIRL